MSTLEPAYQPPTSGPFSIVFIHGLNGHPKTTWMSDPRDPATFWPARIGEDSGCDTWVLGYNAALSRWQDDAMSLPDQGTSVLDRLGTKPELKGRPLILVGHSMGGLVIKTAIVHAMTQGVIRDQELAKHVRGVVFIATPHQGSDLAKVATVVKMTLRTNAQVGDMTAHNHHLLTLNRQFVAQWDQLRFNVRTFVETRGMEVGRRFRGYLFGPRVTVVKPGSGDPHVPGEVPIPLEANHFTICKPSNRHREQIHGSLLDFIRHCNPAPPAGAPPDQSLPVAELPKASVSASRGSAKQPSRVSSEPHPVYVSYAWSEESIALVDELERRLSADLKLMRDKNELRPGDWISSFMKEIGRADLVVIVLSEKYLHSIYCMREMLYLFQTSLGEREHLMPKLVPLRVGELPISRAVDRLKIVRHWKQQHDELEAALEGLGPANIGQEDRAELLMMKDFQQRISDILAWIADTLMPQQSELSEQGLDEVINLLQQRARR